VAKRIVSALIGGTHKERGKGSSNKTDLPQRVAGTDGALDRNRNEKSEEVRTNCSRINPITREGLPHGRRCDSRLVGE